MCSTRPKNFSHEALCQIMQNNFVKKIFCHTILKYGLFNDSQFPNGNLKKITIEVLELRQYKNNSDQFERIPRLNLPHFFNHCVSHAWANQHGFFGM